MIVALIISNMCVGLMIKGVPTWLDWVLTFVHAGCNIFALTMWEETKQKIRALRKGGE